MTQLLNLQFFAVITLSYGLGSIPFGYIIVKFLTKEDIRKAGSRSTGATNVTRTAGVGAGALTYICDVLKSCLTVYIVGKLTQNNTTLMGIASTCVILGHMFPIFLGFHGGKGVATGVGAFLILSPLATLTSLGIWLVIFFKTRIVSLSSILATIAFPFAVWLYEDFMNLDSSITFTKKLPWAILSTALILIKHHENIKRLWNKTEIPIHKNSATTVEENP